MPNVSPGDCANCSDITQPRAWRGAFVLVLREATPSDAGKHAEYFARIQAEYPHETFWLVQALDFRPLDVRRDGLVVAETWPGQTAIVPDGYLLKSDLGTPIAEGSA